MLLPYQLPISGRVLGRKQAFLPTVSGASALTSSYCRAELLFRRGAQSSPQ